MLAYLGTTLGKVLKLGDPLAYSKMSKFPQGAWCKRRLHLFW